LVFRCFGNQPAGALFLAYAPVCYEMKYNTTLWIA